jgi:tryptophan synthase alpha chain
MKTKNKLMTHIVAGYPDMEKSEALVHAMDRAGVAFVEVQIPFSDPVADGPTLMKAQEASLANGTTTDDVFALLERLVGTVQVPLIVMTYYNVVYAYGIEKFCARAAELGVYGLIVPDIPIDEEPHEGYFATCKKYGLKSIPVVGSLTSVERLKKINEYATGMVYCVSRDGTTGAQTALPKGMAEYIARVRTHMDVPLALGFGISTRAHVEAALKEVDIAVMGSAVVNVFDAAPEGMGVMAVEDFLNEIIA